MVGKYLNGYGIDDGFIEPPAGRPRDPAWLDASGSRLTAGTDQRRYRYRLNENGKIRYYGDGGANYVTDVLGVQGERPDPGVGAQPEAVLPLVHPTAPHGEARRPLGSTRDPQPALRHLGRYGIAQAPRTPNFNEEDVSDKPQLIRNDTKLGVERHRRHRPPLPGPAREPARGGRGRSAGSCACCKKTGDLRQDLHRLHLGQRPPAGRAPRQVQDLPLRGVDPRAADRARPEVPAGPGPRSAGLATSTSPRRSSS